MQGPGITLIEMIVVMVIIGILGAVVAPRFANIDSGARITTTRSELVEIQKAIMGEPDFRGYFSDVGSLPAALTDLTAGPSGYNPYTQTGSRGDYLSDRDSDGNAVADVLEDAWGTLYQWDSGTGVVTSYGPNRAAGGGDDLTLDVNG